MSAIPEGLEEVSEALGMSEQKWLNLQAGAVFFSSWLEDQMLRGVAKLELDGQAQLQDAAARLSDYQLSAPANSLRRWSKRIGAPGWEDDFLEELGYWHLLLELVRSPERAQPGQIAAVLNCLGVRIPKIYFQRPAAQHPGTWVCIGRSHDVFERLYQRTTYWTKLDEPKLGVQVQYNFGKPVPEDAIRIGVQIEAILTSFPGGLPGRVNLPERYKVSPAQQKPATFATLKDCLEANTRQMALRPWLRETLFALANVVPVLRDQTLYLLDAAGSAVEASTYTEHGRHFLLGLSGGYAVSVFGVLRRGQVRLYAVHTETGFYGI